MRQNPRNAVIHTGHSNGQVAMWTPNVPEPVVKMFAHAGHVTSIGVHDNYMVTSGVDGLWKVCDLRKYESLHAFRSKGHAVADVDISMNGLVAVGYGCHMEVWKDVFNSVDRPRNKYLAEDM